MSKSTGANSMIYIYMPASNGISTVEPTRVAEKMRGGGLNFSLVVMTSTYISTAAHLKFGGDVGVSHLSGHATASHEDFRMTE